MSKPAYRKIQSTGVEDALPLVLDWLQERTGGNVAGIAWRLVYSDRVSNSHSAPRGKPRNWMRDPNQPTGYPGFSGRLWTLLYNIDRGSGVYRLLGDVCIYAGCGGFGSYNGPWGDLYKAWSQARRAHQKKSQEALTRFLKKNPEPCVYSWGCNIYSQDWAGLHRELGETHQREIMLRRLAGDEHVPPLEWNLEYTAPDALEKFSVKTPQEC